MEKLEAQNVKLKQRNRRLKYELEKLKEVEEEHRRINGELREENKQQQERIYKAIEIAKEKIKRYESYINDLKNGNYPSSTVRQERQELMFRIKEQEELLEILKGDKDVRN